MRTAIQEEDPDEIRRHIHPHVIKVSPRLRTWSRTLIEEKARIPPWFVVSWGMAVSERCLGRSTTRNPSCRRWQTQFDEELCHVSMRKITSISLSRKISRTLSSLWWRDQMFKRPKERVRPRRVEGWCLSTWGRELWLAILRRKILVSLRSTLFLARSDTNRDRWAAPGGRWERGHCAEVVRAYAGEGAKAAASTVSVGGKMTSCVKGAVMSKCMIHYCRWEQSLLAMNRILDS